MSAALLKQGHLEADWYLDWLRQQQCAFCFAQASDVHHFPGKGRSGVRRDDLTCAVCRVCHERCGGATISINGRKLLPISEEEQRYAVALTWQYFWSHANPLLLAQMCKEMLRWLEARGEFVAL
jgi:hypothetical protein